MKLAVFIFLIILNTSYADMRKKVNCTFQYSDDEHNYNGKYVVIRDGDSLFSEYRHLSTDEITNTDDVTYKLYTDEALEEYNESGFVNFLCEAAGSKCTYLKKVSYYAIDQIEEDKFEMQLWKLEGLFGYDLGLVASPGDFFTICHE